MKILRSNLRSWFALIIATGYCLLMCVNTSANDLADLSPVDYWFLEGRGWISEVSEKNGYLYLTVWRPPHGSSRNRIKKEELDDLVSKENGYEYAVRNIIVSDMTIPYLTQNEQDQLMEGLRRLTSQNFRTPDEWVEWWEANHDALRLSETGERLIAGP